MTSDLVQSAEVYDLLYAGAKDYAGEARALTEQIRREVPRASSVLDVGCGTGGHAECLCRDHGFRVDGLDLNPRYVDAAQRKVPTGRFVTADMTAFDLGLQYDAVLCLFGAIGYVETVARVELALRCCAAHLSEHGVLILEPWFAPGALTPDYVTLVSGTSPELHVARMSVTEIDGALSRLHFDYLIGQAGTVLHARETHVLGLFSAAQMFAAFAAAGLSPAYVPDGLTGRGLYVAHHG